MSPARIIVRKTVSKGKHQYFSFLTAQGTKTLLAYLNDRLAHRQALTAQSAVIAPDHNYRYYRGNNESKPFLTTHSIEDLIRESLT